MVYVHLLVSSLRGDKYKKKSAYDDLWKAQNWLGFLGGEDAKAVAFHRQKSFAALLNAEALLRDRANFQSSLTSQDFDLDGINEFLFQGKSYNLYVDCLGGQVFEWDFLDRPWNYIDSSEVGEGPRRQAFVDRFNRSDRPLEDAAFFFRREYRLMELSREHRFFQLMAVDSLEGMQGRQPLRLKKTFRFDDEATVVEYELELLTGPSWEGSFSSEVNFSYPAPAQVSGTCKGEPEESSGYLIVDSGRKTTQEWFWEPRASASFEAGTLAPRWTLVLHPGEIWRAKVSLALKRED